MDNTNFNNNSILFDTTYFAEGLIYDNQFLQIVTTFPSNNVYGRRKRYLFTLFTFSFFSDFGENTHPSFRHNLTDGIRYGVFARDQPPQVRITSIHSHFQQGKNINVVV
jgi:hypothetical protein